jgi:hypothetical protein
MTFGTFRTSDNLEILIINLAFEESNPRIGNFAFYQKKALSVK